MGENCDNPPILSSKKRCSCKRDSSSDPWRDVERLRAALEVERSRNHQAHRRFSLELRRQREEAREERERALRELTYRHEQQKTLELLRQREALGRERAAEVRHLLRWRSQELKRTENLTLRQTQEVHRQLADEIAGRSAFQGLKLGCKGNGAAYRKLEELLKTLLAQSDGWQVAVLQRLQQEVELEKSYFLCHLLEAHSGTSRVVKRSRPRSKSCVHLLPQGQNHPESCKEGKLALFRSRSLSQTSRSDSPQPMKKKKKQDCETSPLSSSPTEDGDLLEDLPEPCSSDEGLEKCSPSRCSEDNMDDLNGRDYGFLVQQNSELLRALEEMEKSCNSLREENRILRKSSSPETEEKVKRLRKKNTELAVIAKRLEERARKLQEANLKVGPVGVSEFERLLKESQKEVLRLQRQLSVTSTRDQSSVTAENPSENQDRDSRVAFETPPTVVDEAPVKGEETPAEGEESETQVKLEQGTGSTHQEEQTTEERLQLLESELGKKRKECEVLEHEVRKRQKRCLDLENQLVDEHSRNEHLVEEAELLRRKAQLLDQSQAENEELKEQLCVLNAQHSSVLEENQRLRAKLENLEQVLKHMREVAERRQQLELEHEQALAILKFKQDEIKRLQRAQLFAKREHEGVVQMLENTLDCMQAKVRELEEKCRSQSEQFGMLSQELDKFRVQASKIDLSDPSLTQLTNGVGLSGTNASWEDIAFWSLEGNEALCEASELDVAAVLRTGSTPHAAELSRPERSPTVKHRELPAISVKSGSTSSPTPPRSETTHLSPKSASPRKASPTHEVDTASEVEELDIDVSPAPYSVSKGAVKLQVFIARYSYNPYDGPNDNPEVELPLTAGEYIYVYGDMDDDGFYEGELMDGRRGLVPSNFVERVSDDDFMSSHPHQAGDMSHNSFQESSFHSGSERLHQHHLRFAHSASERTETSTTASAPGDNAKANPAKPALAILLSNGLDLDLEEVGVDTVPYPRKLALIKQLAKSVIIGWESPLVPAGWGSVFSYNVYVDHELRLNVPFGTQTKAVLERLDLAQKAYRIAVQCLTERGNSDQLRCSILVGRDVNVAPTHLRVERITATSASLTWLPSNSNYVHIVSLNDEECELVKAGCYSLCLSNLTPNMHYNVKVEARPHRTAWELPPECRERKTAVTSFTTQTAGPPDAPLDVQLEQGPSPGIAQISWLPVTIDAAGTSNGVRVTGYTIYADKKKVLEVSSPTAGSALIGPSQIQTLQAARELTVRTMSAFGESVDSLPVNVPAKLPAIMSGASLPQCQSVPATASALTASANPDPAVYATSLSPAKLPILPHAATLDEHTTGPVRGVYVNTPNATTREESPSPASYVEAWANPTPAVPISAHEALSLCTSRTNSTVSVSTPMVTPAPVVVPVPVATPTSMAVPAPLTTPGPMPTPVSMTVPGPVVVPAPATMPVPMSAPIPAPTHAPIVEPASVPVQSSVAPAVQNPSRETDSPGGLRPVASLSDFLEDPCAKLHTPPPPSSSCPKVNIPGKDPLDIPDTHPLRPPNLSPFESEPEEDRENTRLISIEEFLRPVPQPRIKVYAGGLMDPPPDYHGESSRSDLSDILEEEEEDLYSEPITDVSRGYSTAPTGRSEMWEPDSDEEILERIIKLPPQAYHNKQLFSIPEVTEEEDNTESEPHTRSSPGRSTSGKGRQSGHEGRQHSPHHHNQGHKMESDSPVVRYKGTVPVRTRPRVHYADTVDTINYLDEEEVELDSDSSLYAGPSSVSVAAHHTPHKGHGDRLRREALLRSQMTSGTGLGQYLLSKTIHHVKSPTGPSTEIDVEYGTDNDEEPLLFDPGEVVLEQMSSEWWVEGGNNEYHHLPLTCRPQPELPQSSRSWEAGGREASLADPGAMWCDVTPKSPRSEIRLHREPRASGENEVRVFVALFPYDPAVMSPNPDAAEEELPFKEGQIIKVYGDKDADGFYRGEAGGRRGYVPCNMVSEIQVDDEETRDQLLMQGFLSTEASMDKIVCFCGHCKQFKERRWILFPRMLCCSGGSALSFSLWCLIADANAYSYSCFQLGACFVRFCFSFGFSFILVCYLSFFPPRILFKFHKDARLHAQLPRRPAAPPKPRRSKKVESAAVWDDTSAMDSSSQDLSRSAGPMGSSRPRRMVAIFDYDPRESSPNADIEAELTFSAGDVIYVFGDMDDDGFYYGDLNGHKGLVPSNFLQAFPETEEDASVTDSHRDSQVSQTESSKHLDPVSSSQPGPNPEPDSDQKPTLSSSPPATPSFPDASLIEKKKKGFFSKGRKLFRKLGSSKKE
ncbi:peripheral-type benzodiazepine receptor-associated protein 1-like [Sinocyclocheilus rhinocerous]|uniref:peripheral-type benzodiazepine receptor-associated protein 1-like n=1 Tax=Sinocyclocheilus rhinocerous TaxID=307959 RepID=UPI0007B8629B|nr:PREDICTED: peripheral-type benzodiazepine receptor-associated protein 1-like [Sinocyclocheilus rhinocerous]